MSEWVCVCVCVCVWRGERKIRIPTAKHYLPSPPKYHSSSGGSGSVACCPFPNANLRKLPTLSSFIWLFSFSPPSSVSSSHNWSLSLSFQSLSAFVIPLLPLRTYSFLSILPVHSPFLSPATVNLLLVNRGHLPRLYLLHFLLDHYTTSLSLSLSHTFYFFFWRSECFLSHFSLHSLYSFKGLKYISCYLLTVSTIQFPFSWLPLISLFGFCCEAESEFKAPVSL